MSKLKKLFSIFRKRAGIRQLLINYEREYLYETGWTRSAIEGKPVDKNGEALPWISIPTIEILKERNLKDLFIFEYGSGNSTIWFAKRVKKIISIEHDKQWYEFVSKQVSGNNIKVCFTDLVYGSQYASEIQKYTEIDIALIDGRDRVNCSINAITQLSERGIIILDDSQRENYQKAIDYIKRKGFRELKLVGMNVGRPMKKATSIFYRDNNCLGL